MEDLTLSGVHYSCNCRVHSVPDPINKAAVFAYQIEQTLAATAIYVDVFHPLHYIFAPFRIQEARDSQSNSGNLLLELVKQ